ncbi:hypothetical protein [Dokdonella sp.]|uniref:hypothetical protein n=1 Tax=Dokdonella sp. TaxID=2291710 RepID=UPI001B072FD4|nr:hypothetical protein [Dokdonella sp.]MBO9661358.1 hypothetical protein [Dokdonella sp.]
MRVISSRWTYFYKRVVPLIGWSFPALAILRWLSDRHSPPSFDPVFLLIPIGTAVLTHVFLHALSHDLADEVVEAGDSLIVRKAGEEARIALAEIINVDASTLFNPPRITLSLRTPCRFGAKIVFSPPPNRHLFAPFAPNPTAEALIERVHRARMAR